MRRSKALGLAIHLVRPTITLGLLTAILWPVPGRTMRQKFRWLDARIGRKPADERLKKQYLSIVDDVNLASTFRGLTMWQAIRFIYRVALTGDASLLSFLSAHVAELNSALGPDFFVRVSKLDDRSMAIVVTSMLDRYLGMSVLAKFAKVVTENDYERVFEGMGPLATFSAKISLCSVLGILVGDMQHDLNIMRKIRNDFAHEVKDIDFTYREISSRCHSLKMTCDLMPGVLENAKTTQRKRFLESGAANLLHLSAMLQRNVIVQTVLQENISEINRRAREAAGIMIEAASKSAGPETQPTLPGISS